jgi:Ser/Thr protein kinase RdoA (MazF antagonist)
MSSEPPYAGLTPDTVLDALASAGFAGDGRLLALNSYENRVYQVWLDDPENPRHSVVAKFYRPGRWSETQILEEHSFVAELAEREIPVVAPLVAGGKTLHRFGGFLFAVYPRRGGRTPELEDPDTLEWMGRFIGRIHAMGATRPFSERPALDIESFGREPRGGCSTRFIPADLLMREKRGGPGARERRARYERAGVCVAAPAACHASNVLWTDEGPHFVDFDDCRSGPAVQDLWMLLSGDRASMTRQLSDVLAGYEDFAEFDPRELHLLEALRTLRLIHYAAWLARRWDDPAFPAAFPWFNTQRYWQDRILELKEQIALMQEAPLQV